MAKKDDNSPYINNVKKCECGKLIFWLARWKGMGVNWYNVSDGIKLVEHKCK